MFSKELEISISQAYQEAREKRHEFLTVEHMLLALLDNASAMSIISALGADVSSLAKEIQKVLSDTVPVSRIGARLAPHSWRGFVWICLCPRPLCPSGF